ncbi:MAG: phosphatase PAP2 family protein [Methylococcaceae bacterium]|nr:phosphatase PAP2 family protein [Prolixibacteraceae bacterium]
MNFKNLKCSRIIFVSALLTFILTNVVKAESKRDTLVCKAWRDTFKVRKAQIVDVDSSYSLMFYRPKPLQFFANIPSDLAGLGKAVVAKKNLPELGILLAATAIIVPFDQRITDASQQFGRYLHLDPSRESKTLLQFNIGNFHVNALEIPDNANSTIYYLGEGWSSILLAGSFYGYGLISNDYRAVQTSSQIVESIFALGLTTQFLKRITGRQSPFRVEMDSDPTPGGKWHPFISPAKYQKSVSNYDAYPSGHLATIMSTITILAQNYPEKKYIKPVGYSLMTLLGYSMLNNGVHWMSDYPLAIAIGYTTGKIISSRGHQIIPKLSNNAGSFSSVTPAYYGNGGFGLSYRATF